MSLATCNIGVTALSLSCVAVQYLLDKKLSRQVEERARVEGAFFVDMQHDECQREWMVYIKNKERANVVTTYPIGIIAEHPKHSKTMQVVQRVLG